MTSLGSPFHYVVVFFVAASCCE